MLRDDIVNTKSNINSISISIVNDEEVPRLRLWKSEQISLIFCLLRSVYLDFACASIPALLLIVECDETTPIIDLLICLIELFIARREDYRAVDQATQLQLAGASLSRLPTPLPSNQFLINPRFRAMARGFFNFERKAESFHQEVFQQREEQEKQEE